MPSYRAEIPLVITSSQRNDRFGFRTSWDALVEGEVVWAGFRCRITSGNDGLVRATFEDVPAANEGEAFAQVCAALNVLAPLVSLEVQRLHANRHYGPLRVTWSRADVAITPSDNWPAASVGMRATSRVSLTRANEDLAVVAATPELRPLLLSYDRALAPDDEETRFFNAFAILEFIEARFATHPRFAALLDDAVADAVLEAASACARGRGLAPEVVQRVGNLLGGPLRRATVEGRDAKLLAVLRGEFGITYVEDALGRVEVDLELVRGFTGARNRLFHGAGGAAAGLPRLTDRLTLVVEQVLSAFLERRVALPAP